MIDHVPMRRPVPADRPGGQLTAPDAAVIIPAYNCSKTIVQTLESVDRSIFFCGNRLNDFKAEVVVVVDNATDDTYQVTADFARGRQDYRIIRNQRNLGAGPSRNIGVANSKGELLFFLDGDDIYHEDHIYLCVYHLMRLPQVHYARTRVRIREEIHPYWKEEIEKSIPINICVRRWCHEFIGGYYEDEAFNVCTCEDFFYRKLLRTFCPSLTINKETVEHFRYPGNALDRQMQKFAEPPDAGINSLSEAEQAVMPEILQIQSHRTEEINNRLTHWVNFLRAAGSI